MSRTKAIGSAVLALAVGIGCDRGDSPSSAVDVTPQVGGPVDQDGYAKLRAQAVEQHAGAKVTAVRSADELLGSWEMRFGGPMGSDKVQSVYRFAKDGTVKVGEETWRWRLTGAGHLVFVVTVPPDPTTPGLEGGATSEEERYAFKTADGRIVLSNEDTSVIEFLKKAPAAK